jgi:hypothetical protein
LSPRIGQSAAKADQRGGEEDDADGSKRNYLGPDRIRNMTWVARPRIPALSLDRKESRPLFFISGAT